MATTNLELPTKTNGLVETKQSLKTGFEKLDEVVHETRTGANAYTHAETDAETVKDALDDLFTRLAVLEAA